MKAYKGHSTRSLNELRSCAASTVGPVISENLMLTAKEKHDKVLLVVELMELKVDEAVVGKHQQRRMCKENIFLLTSYEAKL